MPTLELHTLAVDSAKASLKTYRYCSHKAFNSILLQGELFIGKGTHQKQLIPAAIFQLVETFLIL
jgi:hypothetical protein